jgi:NAD(P)-dependent dehydrogenase (short-subunit alcohol dehydrogenase family)
MPTISRRRTIVVGASSGLGRCIAVDRGRRGDHVALLARRRDRLVTAAAEAGDEHVPIACDVTDETSCRDGIQRAADELGGIDAVVYAAGIGPMCPIAQVDAVTWRRTLETNVIGAALVTAAALAHLEESAGRALYLSSVSATSGRPWPGLGAYTVSKVALERLIDVFRVEHPRARFTRVVVGDCTGGVGPSQSEFPKDWDRSYAGDVMGIWRQRGYFTGALMDVVDLLDGVDFVLGSGAAIPSISLVPTAPPVGDS